MNNKNSGYNYSLGMSNRAMEAYEDGARPFSKWTKNTIIKKIIKYIYKDNIDSSLEEKLRKHTIQFLKKNFLSYHSWHHTSFAYNKTKFYELDFMDTVKATEIINQEEARSKVKKTEWYPVKATWKIAFKCGDKWERESISRYGKSNGRLFVAYDGIKKFVKGIYYTEIKIDSREAKEEYKKKLGTLEGYENFFKNN